MARHRVSGRYHLVLLRPGRPSLTLAFSRLGLLAGGLALLLLFLGGFLAYERYQRLEAELSKLKEANAALVAALSRESERREEMRQELMGLLEELEGLEKNLTELRRRAGLAVPEEEPLEGGQGAGRRAEFDELAAALSLRLAELSRELEAEVAPALTLRLAEEAARPLGWPLPAPSYISSGFGVRRSPFGRGYEFHDGVDIPAYYGTEVRATAPGVVIEAGWSPVLGRYVRLDHGFGFETLYGHMARILVEEGERVERGQAIGYVGSTGRSTGPHVHYSVFKDKKAVDPRSFLSLR